MTGVSIARIHTISGEFENGTIYIIIGQFEFVFEESSVAENA